ncbi:MAG: ATP-binding protein [Candidatus Viridilinea halotolerans]|uniref:ATP-binding protein n=1 Tax=Candidatus Viridilinea halotolerans TaxID=2491704 RepID=A0A426TZQ0_9CHLR|nr:MAG: ATP-binding protein [Candidatus Viridilinea halotolerans]
MRFFNTAGPCNPDDHYMLPATARLPDVQMLLDQKAYFVLHGPRQSGKTTAMIELARQVTAAGRYAAALVSMEVGAAFNTDPGAAELAILSSWRMWAESLPVELRPPPWPEAPQGQQLATALHAWCQAIPRPLILFLDEIDALQDVTLISVLRQLRSGYPKRPAAFPWALAVIGLRDVRDYKVASGGSDRLHTASPFNVKVESLTLRNFSIAEVAELYTQHTSDTGQVFTPEALQLAFDLTQGQPWLVNALARQAVQVVVRDPSQSVDAAAIRAAKELLIQRQDTHLDSLAERLREPRVRHVIEPMLAGRALADVPTDDIRFVLDLGLCRMDHHSGLVIANPIYREVIPRVLAFTAQASLPHIRPTWLQADGRLDVETLRDAFLAFWRQHGQPLLGSAPYHEIAPHLVLMAFLHRVVNGDGTLEREYAIGSGRMDLCLRYGDVTLGIELKVWRDGEGDPRERGLAQLDAYLDGLGLDTGWLVIFDRRSEQPPISQRTSSTTALSPAGRMVTVIRA